MIGQVVQLLLDRGQVILATTSGWQWWVEVRPRPVPRVFLRAVTVDNRTRESAEMELSPLQVEFAADANVVIDGMLRSFRDALRMPLPPDDGLDPSDTEARIEQAWREETGSVDPQGPPVGWRPGTGR